MKKIPFSVLCVFPFFAAVSHASEFDWTVYGPETNSWNMVKEDGTTAFSTVGTMPGESDNVVIPSDNFGHRASDGHEKASVKIPSRSTVSIEKLLLGSGETSAGTLIIEKDAILKLLLEKGSAADTYYGLSMGGRDGGMGAYRNTDYATANLIINGGTLECLNSAIALACSIGINSHSSMTLNDGILKTKGLIVGYYGSADFTMKKGLFLNSGTASANALRIGEAKSADYPARSGLFMFQGGTITNESPLNLKRTGRFIQTGGTYYSHSHLASYDSADNNDAYGVMELRGGSFISGNYGFAQGTKGSRNSASLRISIYGTMGEVSCSGLFGSARQYGYTNQWPLVEYVIADGKVTPLTLNLTVTSALGNSSCDRLKKWMRPDGGVQLISTDRFVMFKNSKTNMTGQDGNTTNPNPEVWETANFTHEDGYYRRGCTLNESIKIEDDIISPTPFGYIELPGVKTNSLISATVKMTVIPQGNATLNSLVKDMTDAGHRAKLSAGNSIQVELPIARLGNLETNRKFFFDFTRQDSPHDACTGTITTNALVSSISYTTTKSQGLNVIIK